MDSRGDFVPPEALSFDGNPAENWRVWKQRFELFLKAREAHGKNDEIKIAMLLTSIGPEALERYNHFTWVTEGDDLEDQAVYATVLAKFEVELSGLKRVVFSRYQFRDHKRGEAQPFNEYLTQLKVLARACEFLERDNMIRDKIVFSTKGRALKERLLRDTDLTLAKTIMLCRSQEVTQKEMQSMKKDGEKSSVSSEKEVHTMSKKGKSYQNYAAGSAKPAAQVQDTRRGSKKKTCGRCDTRHPPRKCPAWGQTFSTRNGTNHYAILCLSRKSRLHEVSHVESSSEDEFFIDTVVHMVGSEDESAWYSVVVVGGSRVKVKLDTGAGTNVLPYKTFKKIKNAPPLTKSTTTLQAYGGYKVEHMGKAMLECSVNGQEPCKFEFFVTSTKSPPILGLQACTKLGLVQKGTIDTGDIVASIEKKPNSAVPLTRESALEEFKEQFQGLGKQKPYHIEQKPDIKPTIDAPRRVPLSLHARLKSKLDEMEAQGVITKVDGPTEWVNSLVIVEKKDGSLRLCLDPTKLNMSIKREHFMIPTLEDVTSRIGNKSLFTVLDQKDAYWQVPLDEPSSYLCTFNTPFGRYRFTRMPFGICSASEVLQKRAYETFGDIEGVHVIADDMLIAADDDHDHDCIFRNVMHRSKDKGVKFNIPKMQFKKPEVVYNGNVIGAEGMKPDDLKVKAIADMPPPESKEGVRRLIGMLNYLSAYIPNMSTVTGPIRCLLKSEVQFQWMPEQQAALDQIKLILSSKPVLRFFDEKKEVTIQADSSSTGLGACLIQEGRPVSYASRSLTETEIRWSQIEKELLAIVFATERFHQYIYGRDVVVHSDHRPLETILKKPIHSATPRIQVMMLKLMRYRLDVKYVPGSELYIADTLSRAYSDAMPPGGDEQEVREMEERIHSLHCVESLPVSPERLEMLKQATAADTALCVLTEAIEQGWPKSKKSCPSSIKPYWTIRDELHIAEDLVFKGNKLVIPDSMRNEMLAKLHESHLGMEKCKSRARSIMYWPGISQDIEDTVAKCATCAKYKKRNQREPLQPHSVPERPWAKIGSDIFDFGGKAYLVLVDYFSKWPEVCKLERKTAHSVISHLKTNIWHSRDTSGRQYAIWI